ncbi:Uncharacterised protein [Burkholderia pseudomallei]|nr:Uncharacterised protein [Burkholderia pseudomallei]CAJ6022677.1 Uncharacterised protein [Burkholderia pseudomallei]VCM35911.1 Uncharacterised protein [Burkholderia pseudomallei]VCM46510.1 Uncharacterised protein [Burkholderia pseudomallei]VCM64084.1 Uncharacterised protein [Burkholderia pseudomallei]
MAPARCARCDRSLRLEKNVETAASSKLRGADGTRRMRRDASVRVVVHVVGSIVRRAANVGCKRSSRARCFNLMPRCLRDPDSCARKRIGECSDSVVRRGPANCSYRRTACLSLGVSIDPRGAAVGMGRWRFRGAGRGAFARSAAAPAIRVRGARLARSRRARKGSAARAHHRRRASRACARCEARYATRLTHVKCVMHFDRRATWVERANTRRVARVRRIVERRGMWARSSPSSHGEHVFRCACIGACIGGCVCMHARRRATHACAAMGEPPRRARPPASESAGESANSYRRVECGYVLIS